MKTKDFAFRYGKKVKKNSNHQKFKLTEKIEMSKSKDDFFFKCLMLRVNLTKSSIKRLKELLHVLK